ncbi:SDR family oxidoreductase [Pseudozobellia sp. WGM2]|uniref:SDR family oxidoreductase n=1 Tax=Pseudozobellia sp. WGM2 TaxID=2787625 RepID=UPI001ADF0DEE|nr:SDR family oxidoreductase [Pseudozobellia sp. WGM2]
MDLKLKDKVVVICGAAGKEGSIGETILSRLVDEGAIPAIIDRNDRGYQYAEKIQKKGIDALFCKTDVTKPEEIENAIRTIAEKYGRIDVVLNNVGVNDGVGLDASYEEFMQSLKLNMVSYFLIVKHALPFLKKSKGNILNIGSKVALTGQGRTSGYAASKGGVLALTREWAVDLVPFGIRSNAIIIAESWTPSYDSWIKTLPNGEAKLKSIVKKIPLENRMTETLEIADTCLFTISERSSHTTGQFIFVDGGYVHLDRALLTEQ